jgi:agmatine deiminase
VNFYLVNNGVVGARFGDEERDGAALRLLRQCFPDRAVQLLDVPVLASLGGGIRCLAQPIPAQ